VEWIHPAQEKDRWQGFVYAIINVLFGLQRLSRI
jgi:hypothetical protein